MPQNPFIKSSLFLSKRLSFTNSEEIYFIPLETTKVKRKNKCKHLQNRDRGIFVVMK